MEPSTMLKQEVSPVEEEAMGPSPKKRCTEDMVSEAPVRVKEEREDPVRVKEEREDPVRVKEEREDPVRVKEEREDPVRVKEEREDPVRVKEEDVSDNEEAQVGMTEGDSKPPTVYLRKCDKKRLKSEAEDASPQGSLPDGALHLKEEVKVEAAEENASLEHSASPANAPATSSLAISCYVLPLGPEDANQEIKYALMAEIRRFGRHYGRIFELLEEVQGPLEVQIQFVKFAIKEAARFKRYHLISYLDEMLDKLMSESTIRGNLNLSA
ncbi:integrator complex subunit 6-like [Peromyscus leucopus]|uniref:integrator complex subunit 6-like n=1 Tax=Peromyscus leucopus TaxID=10041 RepID=UPI001884C77B|nr:integrator complex subunit 6-like [Peromyscus leucopus]XP_037055032.1 integrator complex subunit 6-like [Peromyscus leucopus]